MFTDEELSVIPQEVRDKLVGLIGLLNAATVEIGLATRTLEGLDLPPAILHRKIDLLVSKNESLRREIDRLNRAVAAFRATKG